MLLGPKQVIIETLYKSNFFAKLLMVPVLASGCKVCPVMDALLIWLVPWWSDAVQ